MGKLFPRGAAATDLFPLLLLSWGVFVCGAGAVPAAELEPEFRAKLDALDEGDVPGLIEAAKWARELGYVREMLVAADQALGHDPNDPEIRRLLHHAPEGAGWTPAVRPPDLVEATPVAIDPEANARFLRESRDRIFEMRKRATWFEFWSDLDRERVEEYALLMNRYYDRTKRVFGSSRSQAGIPVRLYGKRREYLDYYRRRTGASGENIGGFYAWTEGGGYLCFYDDPYDRDEVDNTARHECTHLMVRQALDGGNLANWLDEGFACYLAAFGEERIGTYPARCYLRVREAVRTGNEMKLAELRNLPYDQYDFDTYALAWSWAAFLMSRPETAESIPKLFLELRLAADEPEAAQWGAAAWTRLTNEKFDEVVGRPAELQPGWRRFVERELGPTTLQQKHACARVALEELRFREDEEAASMSPIDRVREAEGWIREARSSDDPDIRAAAEIDRAWAVLMRALVSGYDQREIAYTALVVTEILDDLVSNPSNLALSGDAASVSLLVLRRLALGYAAKDDEPVDLVATIAERTEGARKGAARDQLDLERQVAANLVRVTREACKRALAQNPAHRRAAAQWLLVGLLYAPDEIEAAFPFVKFQVEFDPDDRNLAALAAAYSALGLPDYAAAMLARARKLQFREGGDTDLFAEFAERR